MPPLILLLYCVDHAPSKGFTDDTLRALASGREGIVFLLWGNAAREKAKLVEAAGSGRGHVVLQTVHPSGLSASRGFFGCRHFSQCNSALERMGKEGIAWQIQ